MLDGTDLKLAAEVAHPAGFQLENADRISLVQNLICFRIVQREVVNRQIDAALGLDHFAGVSDDRQCLEAKKVHF